MTLFYSHFPFFKFCRFRYLQLIWKSIVDASKLSIHGTLKRDYLVLQNIFTKEEGKEFRNRIENRFALQQKDEVTTTIQPEVIDKVE